ncbi:MAG TPA: cytochrome c oxidase subunit 4 [Sporichthyaceae bacterium]|nr:cytochrome c oxidase subunit 4 [Sporichthyaceae bacterium]
MKVEGNIFAGTGVFVLVVTPVYWHYSQDPTGTAALILTLGLCALTGFYLLFTARRVDARPEDNPVALIEDGAGEMGFYSPYSWWPLALGLSAATAFLGVCIGWWLVILAVPFFAVAVYGLVFEYYRGEHAH